MTQAQRRASLEHLDAFNRKRAQTPCLNLPWSSREEKNKLPESLETLWCTARIGKEASWSNTMISYVSALPKKAIENQADQAR